MTQASLIIGIVFVVIGSLAVFYGLALCYTTKGEYFNDEEVRAMLAQEAEEERAKREEDLAKEMHDNTQASEETVKHKTRGILIAS